MEIYSFYQVASILTEAFTITPQTALLIALAIGCSAWLTLFVLQGVGIYTMAKRRGLKKRFFAFIPFVNIWYIGKLAGECRFFSQRVKRAGMYAMITQMITTLLTFLAIAAELFLWFKHGAPVQDMQQGIIYWSGLTGFSQTVSRFYDISGYLLPIFQLVSEVFLLVLVMGLYKKYTPQNYMGLSFLTLFVPISRFIIIFVLRNRAPIDYDAYVRARREAYMRRQQQYQNPYGNPYSPYGNNQGQGYGQNAQASSHQKPDEPFEEFSSVENNEAKKGDENPFEEMNETSEVDDFFS